jgi:hypothetical protein
MLKKALITLTLPLLLILVITVATPLWGVSAQPGSRTTAHSPQRAGSAVATASESGTFQKMIVENGSVTMDLDLNAFDGSGSLVARPVTLQFLIGANSFFPILVFNDLLRGPQPGSMSLIPVEAAPKAFGAVGTSVSQATRLPLQLGASLKQLVVEKLSSDQRYDLAVRDGNTGFTFFNVEGGDYDYDANAQSLSITNGRLLISKEFANALGRPSDAGAIVGKISVGAAMQPIEIDYLVNGEPKSVVMPPLQHAAATDRQAPTSVPGPDVIVGDLPDMEQFGSNGTFVGLGVATTSCNNGTEPLHWFQLPQTDHPVIPQNLYRMSGGANNNDRFEQVGQSWLKHAFFALEDNACSFGCNTNGCATGSNLCPGCSDPYSAGLNATQDQIGSRAWVDPFTGNFPSTANNHSGHNHTGTSHRVTVATSDLIPAQNPGATYFAEAQYVTPHEYAWCQANPGQCNQYNNASYRQFTVTGGPTSFSFSPAAQTVRMQPAIQAWTGATVNQNQPDPGNDGIWFIGYKVTGPNAGIWHYEYALYNENLDRAIQSFSVPLGPGVNVTNVGFHAPPQEPGWANDNISGGQGYSSIPWDVDTTDPTSITWSTETFAQNQSANAIRWGTLYNFRFDADQPPSLTNATVGFFKTGSPMGVSIQAPGDVPTPSPSPTPTASPTATPTATSTPTATATATATATPPLSPTPTPSDTPTPSATANATATATATMPPPPTPTSTPTATATATSTPRPTPTPRPAPAPRERPTPHPRP